MLLRANIPTNPFDCSSGRAFTYYVFLGSVTSAQVSVTTTTSFNSYCRRTEYNHRVNPVALSARANPIYQDGSGAFIYDAGRIPALFDTPASTVTTVLTPEFSTQSCDTLSPIPLVQR